MRTDIYPALSGNRPDAKLMNLKGRKDVEVGKNRLREAAKEFESLMLEQMMREMRKNVPRSGLLGENVRISPIAISHGSLSMEIRSSAAAEPPAAVQAGGNAPESASVAENPAQALASSSAIILFKGEVDLKEVVDGLNKVGASPQDLVQVLKIIKTAGALHAELEIR